jgi:hypothetical protein
MDRPSNLDMRQVGWEVGADLEGYRVVNPDPHDGWVTFENTREVYRSVDSATGVPLTCNDYYTFNHTGDLTYKEHCINAEWGIDQNSTIRMIYDGTKRLSICAAMDRGEPV